MNGEFLNSTVFFPVAACPVGCVCSAIPAENDNLLIRGNDIMNMPKLPEETAIA